jgi:hypothetical protein
VVAATNTVGTVRAASAEVGPVKPAGPSKASIEALLRHVLVPHGKGAKIGALLKNGSYKFSFKAPSAGRLRISWAVPQLKIAAKLVHAPEATLSVKFHKQGTAKVKIQLTGAGRKLLKHANKVKLIAAGTFAAADGQTGSASRAFTLTK